MALYYQTLVEHFFRLGTRYERAGNPVQQGWIDKVRRWLTILPESDRRLILDTFGKKGERQTHAKLNDFRKRKRLETLEKSFAIWADLL